MKIISIILVLLVGVTGFSEEKLEEKGATDFIHVLIVAATTRPWPGKNFPELPAIPSNVAQKATLEIESSPDIKKAYEKLDAAKQKNVTLFKGIEELEKQKAVWCLQTALCHPHEDVQIHAIKALGRLSDERSLSFLLTYASAMAVYEGGSENATIHGIIHTETAKTLSAITRLKFRVPSGQNPDTLKSAIYQCQKWQLYKATDKMQLKNERNGVQEKAFGKAKIKLGMTKDEVLKQIDLSQSQYEPLDSEKSGELYINTPDAEIIEKEFWDLQCPTRNSKYLGGGSGIRLDLFFEKDKLKKIEILPWLAG